MKLLIVTQVVDIKHPILGFFHRWIIEFAKHCEQVHVIALQVGEYDLPKNVFVHSLGKEEGVGRFGYVLRFYKYIWKYRKEYDHVFVHMNAEYVVLAGWLWRLLGKRVGLWYVHRKVSLLLYVATIIVDYIFSTSSESFRLFTKKLHCLGHGIDMDQFELIKKENSPLLRIITTGRVSKTKRIAEIIDAAALLEKDHNISLTIVGGPASREDNSYFNNLKEKAFPYITFTGPLAHANLPKVLSEHDVFINLSSTGSKDKAVLEALASGLPTVTTNSAFKGLLQKVGLYAEALDPQILAQKILEAKDTDISNIVREVRKQNSLDALIHSIVLIYEKS